jgi:hypothetical protein
MATPEYSQISDEELNRSLLGNRTIQAAPQVAQEVQVAEPSQGVVKPPTRPANTSSVPNAAAPPSRVGDIDLTGMVNQVTNATTQMQQDMPAPKPADSAQHIMDLVAKHWQIPVAIVGAGATAAILNNLMRGGDGTRPPPNPGGLANPVEPSMDVNKQGPREPYLPEEKPTIQSRNFTPKYSAEEQGWIAKSEANRIAKEQDAARRAAAASPTLIPEPPAFILNKPAIADVPPNAPKKMWEPPTASLAASAPALPSASTTTTPVVESPKATVLSPNIEEKLGSPTLTTGSGMPAYEGLGAEGSKLKHKDGKFASLNDIPKGTVFVPGGNYMDTLRNATGQAAYTENLKSTGGYPATNEATATQARTINASLNRPTREQAIAQGLSLGENTPPITKKVAGRKMVTVAGVTGALIALPDLASAAQNQNTSSTNKLINTAGSLGLATMMRGAVPPPTLRPTDLGQGGSLLRSLTDQLQLKQ